MNKNSNSQSESSYSSPLLACSAILLIFAIHVLLLVQFLGCVGNIGMIILTFALFALFFAGALKLGFTIFPATRTKHLSSRRYYLTACGCGAAGCLLTSFGILLRYAAYVHWHLAAGNGIISVSEILGLANLWYAATLAPPNSFTRLSL